LHLRLEIFLKWVGHIDVWIDLSFKIGCNHCLQIESDHSMVWF
jgi:hypothetical protein